MYLFFLCAIPVGSIDSVVQSTCIAKILSLRVSSPQWSLSGTAIGAMAVGIAKTWAD